MDITHLPDELLIEMCEGWDTPTLLNMSQAYSRVYQVCEKVRNGRRDVYTAQKEYEQRINNLTQQILKAVQDRHVGFIEFKKIFDNGVDVEITISKGSNPMNILITQGIQVTEYPIDINSIPWILPGTKFMNLGPDIRSGAIKITDMVKLRQLAKNLIDQGYQYFEGYQ